MGFVIEPYFLDYFKVRGRHYFYESNKGNIFLTKENIFAYKENMPEYNIGGIILVDELSFRVER